MSTTPVRAVEALDWPALSGQFPQVRLLVLIGSRATGKAHDRSDWDLGFLDSLQDRVDVGTFVSTLTHALGTDEVDVVDLAGASAVLRRDAAMDGVLLGEREPGSFHDFQIEAMQFWYDAEPAIREAHADVLQHLAG